MSKRKITVLYKYCRYTKEYVSSIIAQPNPEVPGDILINAFTTTRKPPMHKDGYARVFNEPTNRWRYIIDKRGTIYWLNNDKCKQSRIWSELGPLPKKISLVPPTVDIDNDANYIKYQLENDTIYVPCTDVYERYFALLFHKYLLEHPSSFIVFIYKDNHIVPFEMDRCDFIKLYKLITNNSYTQLTKQIESENGLLAIEGE